MNVSSDQLGMLQSVFRTGVATIACLCVFGCNDRPRSHDQGPQIAIKGVGTLAWRAMVGRHIEATIRACKVPASPNTDRVFRQAILHNEESIRHARRAVEKAPTPEIRRSYEEEIRAYQSGFYNYVGSWPRWPMVMMFPILGEDVRPTEVFFVCRLEGGEFDFCFKFFSEQYVAEKQVIDILRQVAGKVAALPANELAALPAKRGPVFDVEGNIARDLVDLTTAPVFIRQR